MSARRSQAYPVDGRDLMSAVAVDEEGAFDRLVDTYGAYIRALVARYVRNASSVEELSQEVLLRLYRTRARYEPTARFETFLHKIIFNLCVNHSQYHRRRRAVSLSNVDDDGESVGDKLPDWRSSSPEQEAELHERAVFVHRAIERLPANQRSALTLSRFQGLTYDEVSRTIGLSVDAVKSLIWRAGENLRHTLRPQLAD
jgi:RNA polymerase sigma-70 factor, ECF subfamily